MTDRVVSAIQRTVLVALGILFLFGLVGISLPNRFAGGDRPDRSRAARLQIDRFEEGLERFLLAHGRYPTTGEGLKALIANPGVAMWAGPYLSQATIPNDPWGRAYHYSSPGDYDAYDLWTLGADGLPGGTNQARDLLNR